MSSGLNFHLQVESFFPGGSEVEVPFADLQFHHFALTLDRDQGLSIGFDGNDPKTIITNAADKIKGDLLIEQLTIGHAKDHSGKEHRGFNGTIAGLHLWKKKLAPAEIRAAGNWHGSYCPTPDFGFNHGVRPHVGNPPNDAPAELLGFLNSEIPTFTFYLPLLEQGGDLFLGPAKNFAGSKRRFRHDAPFAPQPQCAAIDVEKLAEPFGAIDFVRVDRESLVAPRLRSSRHCYSGSRPKRLQITKQPLRARLAPKQPSPSLHFLVYAPQLWTRGGAGTCRQLCVCFVLNQCFSGGLRAERASQAMALRKSP